MPYVQIALLLTLRGIVRLRAASPRGAPLRHQLQVLERSRPRRLRLAKRTVGCGVPPENLVGHGCGLVVMLAIMILISLAIYL